MKATQASLPFEVPEGPVRPSLAKARELVAEVEALNAWDPDVTSEDWPIACARVAKAARRQGAHSVARVVCWLADYRSLDRHGYDATSFRAEDVANRWLSRLERSAVSRGTRT